MQRKLSDSLFFQGIAAEEIQGLLKCLHAFQKDYRKGETILPEGEPTEWIGVVLSGMAVVSYSDIWGNSTLLGSAQPGMVFAEAYACIPDEPLLISVLAAEETSVLFLNINRLFSPCATPCGSHARMLRNLLTLCAGKSLQLSRRILHTSPKSIRGRLLSYFSECAQKAGGASFRIPYNRQQLADYLGVDRSAMCKELSKMQQEGILQYRKNSFRITNSPLFDF